SPNPAAATSCWRDQSPQIASSSTTSMRTLVSTKIIVGIAAYKAHEFIRRHTQIEGAAEFVERFLHALSLAICAPFPVETRRSLQHDHAVAAVAKLDLRARLQPEIVSDPLRDRNLTFARDF